MHIKDFFCSMFFHTPKDKLVESEIDAVGKNGLIHFCESKNIDSILNEGVKGGLKTAMFNQEKGYTWFYIYDKSEFDKQLILIHSKGNRSKYDAYIIVKNLSEEQLQKLRIRRQYDNAIIFPGTLKTGQITGHQIEE